jgi:hypothetical protein
MQEGLPPTVIPDFKKLPFTDRKDLKIEYVETQFYPDLATWFTDDVKTKWLQLNSQAITAPASGTPAPAPAPAPTPAPATSSSDGGLSMGDGYGTVTAAPTTDVSGVVIDKPPSGPGWVIELKGHHFYNPSEAAKRRFGGAAHVRDSLIKNLEYGFVDVPLGPNQPPARFTMKELGIGFAILARDPPIKPNFPILNPNYTPPALTQGSGAIGPDGGSAPGGGYPGSGLPGAAGTAKVDPENPEYFLVPRFDFIVQFCWVETPLNVRIENRKQAEIERAKAAEAAAATAPAVDPAATAPATPTGPASTGPAATGPAATGPAVPPEGAPPAAPPTAPAAGGPVIPVDPAAAGAPVPAPVVPVPAVPDAAGAPIPDAGVPDAAAPGAVPPGPAAPGPAPPDPAAAPAPVIPAVPDVPM